MTIKTFQIFRSGSHVDIGGREITFSELDVASMASAYNETRRPAPLVLGHPGNDLPSLGVVKKLLAKGGALYAIADVAGALIDRVRKGDFKKVSASFLSRTDPANPAPGNWYLRHVGFLGAMPPAIKGLAALQFAERDAVCFAETHAISFAQSHGLDGGLEVDAGRLAMHQAALSLVQNTPGMNYATAAYEIDRRLRDRSIETRRVTIEPHRAAFHEAALCFQEAVQGASYAEAVIELEAAGMRL